VRRAEAELEQAKVVADQTRTVVSLEVERARRDLVRTLAAAAGAARHRSGSPPRAYELADGALRQRAHHPNSSSPTPGSRCRPRRSTKRRALADYRLAVAAMEKAIGRRLDFRFMSYSEIPAILPQEVMNP